MQPWYGNPIEGPSTSWFHWDFNSHYPADPTYLTVHEKRDVASVYYPIIGAYDSYDPKVIIWQIDICKAMLIDCIMIDYYGDGISPVSAEFQHYKAVTDRIISQAADKGIKVVLLYETQVQKNSTNMVADILSDLNSIINNTGWMNSKAYLHYNCVPVICIFGIDRLHYDDWSTIKNTIGSKACLVADTQPYQYESDYKDNTAFNGCFKWHLYDDSINSTVDPIYTIVKTYADGLKNDCEYWAGGYWWINKGISPPNNRFAFSIIWPGFNDSGVLWGPGGLPKVENFYSTTHSYWTYDAVTDAVLNPTDTFGSNNWVVVATLNDWNESTSIEPSKPNLYRPGDPIDNGYLFAIKTKQFAEIFKAVPVE
jgi:hypothetical protein